MMGPEVVLAEASSAHKYYLWDRIREYGIRIVTDTRLEEVTKTGIRAIGRDLRWVTFDADNVVLALGLRPRKEKVAELRRLIPETEVSIAGDCYKPGSLFTANHDGFNAVCEL